jgi:hypothetical protein
MGICSSLTAQRASLLRSARSRSNAATVTPWQFRLPDAPVNASHDPCSQQLARLWSRSGGPGTHDVKLIV